MPEELERELERALANLPGPSAEAAERAQRAALDALPAAEPARRPWRAPALLAAALAAVLAAAAGVTLAATDTPPFEGPKHHPAPPPPAPRQGPAKVPGMLATYVDGRLWLGRTHGRRFSAVELSPGGLYLAVGQPGRLAVYTPDLRRLVWMHPVAGTVVAISWRPIGTQIAYIVHTGRRDVLHLIQADGDTDQVVDTAVAPVTPSWRWDSQAFAYVGAGGHMALRDLIHDRSIAIRRPTDCLTGEHVTSVAFAPAGRHQDWLAGAVPGGVLAADTATGRLACTVPQPITMGFPPPEYVSWTPHGELLTAHDQFLSRLRIVRGHLVGSGYATAPSSVASIAAAPSGEGELVALIGVHSLTEVLARLPPLSGHAALRITGTVVSLPVAPPHNFPAELFWR